MKFFGSTWTKPQMTFIYKDNYCSSFMNNTKHKTNMNFYSFVFDKK
jgi:hypothetical protein